MIIDIDFLFLSFILHSWSNLVLLSKINIFVWFNEYRGRWPIKHMKCVPWHCPPKQCGLTLQPTPAASRLGWFRCLPPFLRLTKHQTGVQCDELAKVPACWLVPRLPLVAHRALLDYGIPPILRTRESPRGYVRSLWRFLTHCGRDKMAASFQSTFSNEFSWMKMYEFRLTFHWSLFLRVQLTIFQHWFR